MKNLCAIFLILALPMLAACGKGFKAAGPATSTQAQPLGPAPLANKIAGPNGDLSWSEQSNSGPAEFTYEFKIPFAHVYKNASRVVKFLAPYSCQFVQGVEKEAPSAYANGEVPCGRFIDGQWKQLMSVTVDPYYANEDGFDVFVTGATIPIYLSRSARQGAYQEQDLAARALITKQSSISFAQDISVRYSPNGTNAQLELCANLPGGQITAPTQIVNGKAWKKIWGQKISYDSDFTITPGTATFDFGRGCMAATYGWSGESLTPSVQFSTTKAPYVSNANYSGLYIRINDWFLRMVDRIMAHFKISLRQKLTAQVTREANQIIDRDVETGEWFTKLHGPEMIQKTNERINGQINKVVTRVGLPASVSEVRKLIKDNCRVRKLAGGAAWTQRLEVMCRDLVDQIEITVQPFAVDANSQSLGCYSHFANIHESHAWWGQQCKFAARFGIKIPAQWKDYALEVRGLLAAHIGVEQIPADWAQAIQNLNLDNYTLMLLSEELERLGYSQVVPSDWQSRIPGILQQIRDRIAAGTI